MNSKVLCSFRNVALQIFALGFIGFGASALAQGVVMFYNYYPGSVIAHVYGPNSSDPSLHQFGQGANDYPVGIQDWTGFTGLSGSGYTAQLWAADGANQPESSLQPVFPTTTFHTVAIGAGILVNGGTVSLPGVPSPDVATIALRVWDNRGGTVTSWAMAQAAGVALGESPLFNSLPTVAGGGVPAPPLVGLVSFNIYQVPEPSALGLAGVGAVLLWWIWRGRLAGRGG